MELTLYSLCHLKVESIEMDDQGNARFHCSGVDTSQREHHPRFVESIDRSHTEMQTPA